MILDFKVYIFNNYFITCSLNQTANPELKNSDFISWKRICSFSKRCELAFLLKKRAIMGISCVLCVWSDEQLLFSNSCKLKAEKKSYEI